MTQPVTSSAISLRPYQVETIAKARDAMRRGARRIVVVAPTGSGKTRMGSAIVTGAVAKGGSVLWLAHRTELIAQTCATLAGFGLDVAALAASCEWPERPDAPVQVASIQTLIARQSRPPASLLIWDECHHCSEAAEEWSRLLQDYPDVRMVGLTATPERGDGAGLAPLFDGLVVGPSVAALTKLGHLVPCEIMRPERLLENGKIAQHPLEAYQAEAPGTQALLFARTVDEAQTYAGRFTAAGVRAECVHASTPPKERSSALELFRRGVVRVLTNVYVMTEGTDLPMAATCILARGCGSAGQYIQMVGRVLRPHPGKSIARLLDLRGISHVHGSPEDEREYSLDGNGIRLSKSAHCRVCSALLDGGYPCAACGYSPDPRDQDETVVVGVPLVKFARMRAQDAEQRERTLERWVRECLAKSYKPGWVRHRWKSVFGEELSAARVMAAMARVRGGL
jgi:DNA repair protein RadD